ncbi:MAG: DMT family transporter [Lachnospiraceae bacterium]|nr:DMT family transporter [Lachnospiraceae bacterium]
MRPKNASMLLLTAFIWGTAFVAQSVGMDHLEPFTFNGVRCLIGAIALLPCIWFFQRGKTKVEIDKQQKKDLIKAGVACGGLLFAASSLQQIGIVSTTVGKAGFITAFYIVLVPLLGVFLHKKIGWKVWLAVVMSLVGLYFLCITESFSISKGDIYIFLCALLFSFHIMIVDHYSPKVDGVKMSCIQFFVAGVLSIPFMFILETPKMNNLLISWFPLIYAGVFSCGIAYTLQILGQKNVNPAIASLILSLESCFSVLAGWIILGEKLSVRETVGCILMFAAIILAQLPDEKVE